MKVISVSCNNCGAPLEVPHKLRFLTCTFCESRLEIKQSESAYYTDVLEAVDDLKEDVETIKKQNELERLDREWAMSREEWMTTDKHGRRHLPTRAEGRLTMVLGITVGTGFSIVAIGTGNPQIALIGILFAVAAYFMGLGRLGQAKRFDARHQRYKTQRRALTRELRGR